MIRETPGFGTSGLGMILVTLVMILGGGGGAFDSS